MVPARLCLLTGGGDSGANDNNNANDLRSLLAACPDWQWRSAVALLHHALVVDGAEASSLAAGYLPHLPGWAPGVPLPQLPLLWSAAELRELQGALPSALPPDEKEDHADRRRRFAREHLLRCSAFKEGVEREARRGGASAASAEDAAERLLAWALAVVTSRSFGFGGGSKGPDDDQERRIMVPLVDMADHRAEGDAELNAEVALGLADDDSSSSSSSAAAVVVLKASRDVAAGEALAICYGRHNPADTLLSYGFIIDNPGTAPPGPPVRLSWDPQLLLAAFDALVAEAGPGVRETRELPGWQRRALDALFLRGEDGEQEEEERPKQQQQAATAGAKRGGGFGGGGGKKQKTNKAAAAVVRLGGDPAHTPDARLVGAARLLALVKQDPDGVGAEVRRFAEEEEGEGGGGLRGLCAPIGGDDDATTTFPISAAHDAVAARALAGYCALAYRRAFRTTIQEDEKLLAGVVVVEEADDGGSSPPLLLGAPTTRDLRERRELALRFRLAAKRELERVAQTAGAHLKRALARCE